ncbi:MAG: exopolysaccharide biosynthesis polyprenyl glycosylphosphotransferase [Chthoniobacter sp.]|uniref:exopolysaccharide biosynthesis polyprenyl glycosylphosphotransferase n=1 Tax=Chthoniobacter sp. TaxID=2510640 RepID=UPI0032A3857E
MIFDDPFGRQYERLSPTDPLRLRDKTLPDRLVIASLICDALVIVYALVFSFWFRFQTSLVEVGVREPRNLGEYSGHITFGALALLLILTSFEIYERNSLLRFRSVSLQILKASIIWAAGYLCIALVFHFEPPISRLYVVIASLLTPATLLAWRWLFHRYLARSGVAIHLRQRVMVVGWNQEAEEMARTFTEDPVSAYEFVGCLGSMRAGFQRRPEGQLLGEFKDLLKVIHQQAIDMVILADVHGVRGDIIALANTCEREMVQFKVIPSYFQILVSGLHLETVAGVPILGVSRLPLDKFTNLLLKRAVDVAGALVGLMLSAPILAIFGAIVYWESPGPILYRQRRLGQNGMEFDILKIRSMRLDAETPGKVGWTTKNDPRRLRIGAMMRKWNIDEVPQFWNVLKGEMSLVGPRPERPELIRNFKHEIPHYNARHAAKPGITGWAQVNGLRGDTDLTERIKCDLWYLENWSPVLDIQIMLLTFFKREHAC